MPKSIKPMEKICAFCKDFGFKRRDEPGEAYCSDREEHFSDQFAVRKEEWPGNRKFDCWKAKIKE